MKKCITLGVFIITTALFASGCSDGNSLSDIVVNIERQHPEYSTSHLRGVRSEALYLGDSCAVILHRADSLASMHGLITRGKTVHGWVAITKNAQPVKVFECAGNALYDPVVLSDYEYGVFVGIHIANRISETGDVDLQYQVYLLCKADSRLVYHGMLPRYPSSDGLFRSVYARLTTTPAGLPAIMVVMQSTSHDRMLLPYLEVLDLMIWDQTSGSFLSSKQGSDKE
jgi:hypothetical protein